MDKNLFKKNIEELTGETKQIKIANVLNISESKISKWFSGNLLPTLDDLLNISQKYNCSIDWLIGNKTSNGHQMSVQDVCKQLVHLDTALYIKFEINKITEPCCHYDRFNDEVVHYEEEFERPIMYLCNSAELLEEEFLPDGLGLAEFLGVYPNSIIKEHREINMFLVKYIKLKKAYYEGLIDSDSFNHMVECFLENLDKRPITYSREYNTESSEKLPFE